MEGMAQMQHDGGHGVSALRVVIVGAGMAGICAAIKLGEAGITDFTIYEKAGRVGGTWRENTYPGVACDVPSHLYSYSFAPNPDWSYRFSPGDEIETYFEDVARRYGVLDVVRFGTEVTRLAYEDGRWRIGLSDGATDEADVVLAATGVLHHPHYPEIEGLDTFEGAIFHSARWDHGVELGGKRLGVIGNGSTGVQIVSAVVDTVADLTLFQRTPQWILDVPNVEIPADERARFRGDPSALREQHEQLSQMFTEMFADAVVDADSPAMALLEQLCHANLENNVADPELRERLRPSYRAGCKRLVMSADFYPAIGRPNAHLVTDGITRVEPKGVRTADGTLHELDVVVLATGFRADRFLRPIEVSGRGGVSLDAVWANRPSAYLAVSVPDFPNLFMLNGPNGPVGNFSLIEVAELQLAYILQLLDWIGGDRPAAVCASHDAADQFDAERLDAAKKTIWSTGCASWYLDDRGVPAAWPWTFERFRERMAAPDRGDFEVASPAPGPA
jgi:cation diffusion facilitator CzcD-associated flavoprotein CzcO